MNYLTRKNAMNDFDTFFDSVFGNWGVRSSKIPPVDVLEEENAYVIEAELPGYTEEDVNIHVEKHVLHISSEKSNTEKEGKWHVKERSYIKFDRSFSLPEGIDEDKIEAQFENGVLKITLPKSPVEQPKKINISFKH